MARRCLFALIVLAALASAGCFWSPADGPEYWWDDEQQQQMPEGYSLPAPPAAAPHETVGTTRGEPATARDIPPAPGRDAGPGAGVVPRGR
jgi:hypothetical protein